MRLVYSSAAHRDVMCALDHYRTTGGAEVAEDLIDHVESKAKLILRNPRSYRLIARDIRCVNLDRFPYQLLYRIADPATVRVIAFRHHKQHPDFGLNR